MPPECGRARDGLPVQQLLRMFAPQNANRLRGTSPYEACCKARWSRCRRHATNCAGAAGGRLAVRCRHREDGFASHLCFFRRRRALDRACHGHDALLARSRGRFSFLWHFLDTTERKNSTTPPGEQLILMMREILMRETTCFWWGHGATKNHTARATSYGSARARREGARTCFWLVREFSWFESLNIAMMLQMILTSDMIVE